MQKDSPTAPLSTETRAEPGRIWCIGDWAKINPQTGQVYGYTGASSRLATRNEVWDAGLGVVRLRGARNEFCAFQIVIESLRSGIPAVFVTAQDFLGPSRIHSATSIQFFRELYTRAHGKWYPDALLPLDLSNGGPFSVPGSGQGIPDQKVAAVWVDIYIPKSIPHGTYQSVFKVSYRGGMRLAEFTVELEVLDLTLPDELNLSVEIIKEDVMGVTGGYFGVQLDSPRCWSIEREFHRAAHMHRTTLAVLPYGQDGAALTGYKLPLRGTGERLSVAGWTQWDERFGPLLDGSAFADLPRSNVPVSHFYLPFALEYPSPFQYWGTDRFEVENRIIASDFIYHLSHKAWTQPTYVVYYAFQERFGFFSWNLAGPTRSDDVEALLYLSRMIRTTLQGHPALRVLLRVDIEHFHCSGHEQSLPNIEQHLQGYFDLWTISASHWNDQSGAVVKEMVSRDGIRAWLSLPAGEVSETLQAMHDYPWLAWKRGAHGISFRETAESAEPKVAEASSLSIQSDTQKDQPAPPLFYPGSEFALDGPLVTMRLKTLRRGIQEFELLRMAADLRGREPVDELVEKTLPCRPDDWAVQRDELLALLGQ